MSDRADMAAIFAGGEGRRMGGVDKGALEVGGQAMWLRVSERLSPQAEGLAVVAPIQPLWTRDISGAVWVADAAAADGPGAGLLGALRWLERERGADALLLTAPVDAPFLPNDLFAGLEKARASAGASAAIVRHDGGLHPVFGLWRAGCAALIEQILKEERALHRIAAKAGAVDCEAWKGRSPDPFANLNSPEDVAAAESLLRWL